MTRCNEDNRKNLMDFVLNATFDEEVISMDCNDGCEQLAELAERVARGESVESIRPEVEAHMRRWKDCREEFEALVAVLRAEYQGLLPEDHDAIDADKPAAAPVEPPQAS
jgi:hypothetical protein